MTDITVAKDVLLDLIAEYAERLELSKTVGPDYYEPGRMENLDQYLGKYDDATNIITMQVPVKGLRYEDRTQHLTALKVGNPVRIVREETNSFNPNNFTVMSVNGQSLGNLSADLCNALAPLYDRGYAVIDASNVSYIEQIRDRSRYARQGILFIQLIIRLRCV